MPKDIIHFKGHILVNVRFFKDKTLLDGKNPSGLVILDKNGQPQPPIVLDENFIGVKWAISQDKNKLYLGGYTINGMADEFYIYEITYKDRKCINNYFYIKNNIIVDFCSLNNTLCLLLMPH